MSDAVKQSRLESLLEDASHKILTIEDIKLDEQGFVADDSLLRGLTLGLIKKINNSKTPNPYLSLNVAYAAIPIHQPEIAFQGAVYSLNAFSKEVFNECKARAVHLLGSIFMEFSEFPVAEAYFRKAFEIDNSSPYSYATLGGALIEQGALNDAKLVLSEGHHKFPEAKYLEATYAYSLAKCRDFEPALAIAKTLPDGSLQKHYILILNNLNDAKTKPITQETFSELHNYMSLVSDYFRIIPPILRSEYASVLKENGKPFSGYMHTFMARKAEANIRKYCERKLNETIKLNFGVFLRPDENNKFSLKENEGIYCGHKGIAPNREKFIQWAYRLLENSALVIDKEKSKSQYNPELGVRVLGAEKIFI
ncbi:MAG: hypothetical protein Q8O89_06925 [Nanoarchaeota archaeon]|nr:hypothetical protein [Nanoarchaeota archaeon]